MIFKISIFLKKNENPHQIERGAKKQFPGGGPNPASVGILELFLHALAVQLPTGSRTPPSLPDPTCPHVKDYPGLGNPNTLKQKDTPRAGLGARPRNVNFLI